jgi:hypothetical protein
MPDDTRRESDEPYEAPKVEDLDTESGPAVTAAGDTIVDPN